MRSLLALLLTTTLLAPFVFLAMPDGNMASQESTNMPSLAVEPLLASIFVASAAAVLAVAVGVMLALLFHATDLPGTPIATTILLLAFACPATVWSLGQVYCYSKGGLAERMLGDGWRAFYPLNAGGYLSTIFVLAQIHAPLACLIVGRGVERLHHAGLESAVFYLGPFRRIWWLARSLRREGSSALLLVFALAASNFAVPHVLQCRLYPIDIYERMTNYLDPHGALWAALPLTLATLMASLSFAVLTGRKHSSPSEIHQPRLLKLRRGKWLVLGMVWAYLGFTTILPVAALLLECKSPVYFLAIVRDAFPELANSLLIAAGSCVVACTAAFACTAAPNVSVRALTDSLAVTVVGVPTLIVGMAYARFFSDAPWLDSAAIGASSVAVILGIGVRAWPFATHVLGSGFARFSPQWREAATVARMSLMRRCALVTGPLLARPFAAAAAIAYLIAIGDVELGQMLCPPGGGTLTMRLFSFVHFGPTHVAANLSLLLLLLSGLPLWLFFFLADRRFSFV